MEQNDSPSNNGGKTIYISPLTLCNEKVPSSNCCLLAINRKMSKHIHEVR